jgi:protein TonB
MKLGYATATQTIGWFLITSDPDATIRVHDGMHVGVDDCGELSLNPTRPLVEFSFTDDGGLTLQVSSGDLALEPSGQEPVSMVHLGPQSASQLNLLNTVLALDTDLAGEGARGDTVDIRLIWLEQDSAATAQAPTTAWTLIPNDVPVELEAEPSLELDIEPSLELDNEPGLEPDIESSLEPAAIQEPNSTVLPLVTEEAPPSDVMVVEPVQEVTAVARIAIANWLDQLRLIWGAASRINPVMTSAATLMVIAAIGVDPQRYALVEPPAALDTKAEAATLPAAETNAANELAQVAMAQSAPARESQAVAQDPAPEPILVPVTEAILETATESLPEPVLEPATAATQPDAQEPGLDPEQANSSPDSLDTSAAGKLGEFSDSIVDQNVATELEPTDRNPFSEPFAEPVDEPTEAAAAVNAQVFPLAAEQLGLPPLIASLQEGGVQETQVPVQVPTPDPEPVVEDLNRLYLISELTVLRQDPPVYPRSRSATDAAVDLELNVSASGTVDDIQVQNQAPTRFVKAARRAVSKWRFQPVLRNGRPISVRTSVRISFRGQP